MYANLIVEKDGAIATVTVNRPRELNALNQATVRELDQAFRSVADDPTVGAVIITGGGNKAFHWKISFRAKCCGSFPCAFDRCFKLNPC